MHTTELSKKIVEYLSSIDDGALMDILLYVLIILMVSLVIFALSYVAFSYGLYKQAKTHKVPNEWLAWIPVAQLYIMGLLIKDLSKIRNIELWLIGVSVILTLFGFLPFEGLGLILMLGSYILTTYAFHVYFKKFAPNYAVLLTIINILTLTIGGTFIVFFLRNKQAVT